MTLNKIYNYKVSFTSLRFYHKISSSHFSGFGEQHIAKSNENESIVIPSIISEVGENTSVESGKEYIEEGKKEFRHSTPSTERSQQWPRINIITVRLG